VLADVVVRVIDAPAPDEFQYPRAVSRYPTHVLLMFSGRTVNEVLGMPPEYSSAAAGLAASATAATAASTATPAPRALDRLLTTPPARPSKPGNSARSGR